MRKFLVILLSLILLVSFSFAIGCKGQEEKKAPPAATPEKVPPPAAPEKAPGTPEKAPGAMPAEKPAGAPSTPSGK